MRDLYILGGISVTAIVIGGLLFFFGPSTLQSDVSSAVQTAQAGGTSKVAFSVLAQGDRALSVNDRTNYRITTSSDLAALWPMIYGEQDSVSVPDIDFSKYEVLAIFDGSHSSTGYSVQVENVVDANAIRTVSIQHSIPGASCTTLPNPTSPYVLIQVPKTTFSLAHQDDMASSTCN